MILRKLLFIGTFLLCFGLFSHAQDRPPRISHYNHFEYPEAAYNFDGDHYLGYVEARVQLNPAGEVTDFIILRASHGVFAEVVADGLPKTPFRPALHNGREVRAQTQVAIRFERRGEREMMRTDTLREDERFVAHHAYGGFEIADPEALDEELQLRNEPEIVVAMDDDEELLEGEVRMQYFIDRDGSTRLPSALSEADPRLIEFARRTINSMAFHPPRRNNCSVPVLVTQKFSQERGE